MISIETLGSSGRIDVKAINRDELKNEFYPFEVLKFLNNSLLTFWLTFFCLQIIAYKCNDETSFIMGSAALIVDDVNDNLPEISFPEKMETIKIKEETFATLFTATELTVNDIDLGEHATYEIVLTQKEDSLVEFSKAFNIVPSNGYQEQGFTLSVADTKLIDFEVEIWREFDIVVSEIRLLENNISNYSKVYKFIGSSILIF